MRRFHLMTVGGLSLLVAGCAPTGETERAEWEAFNAEHQKARSLNAHEDDYPRAFVWTDPETGCEYIHTSINPYGRGSGVTPRYELKPGQVVPTVKGCR